MRKILVLAFLTLFFACKSKKITADSPEKFFIENLAWAATASQLEKIYPKAEIVEGIDTFEEGTLRRPYSILFPDTEDEVLFTWKDAARTKLHQMWIRKDGRWKSKTGIEIGTTYEELQKLNNTPIKFYGFGWDYSGAVDWNDGKLSDTNVRVFLASKNPSPDKFYGDHIIKASEEEINSLELSVQGILYQGEG